MLRLLTASLFALALAAPAMAYDEFTLAGTWVDEITTGGPNAAQPEGVVTVVGAIRVGDMAITLEVTPMGDIVDQFGGTWNKSGEAGGAVDWICYTKGGATLWIYMDGEMGEGAPTTIALDTRGKTKATAGCVEFPLAEMRVNFGILGIGAMAGDVTARLGTNPSDGEGRFRYVSLEPVAGDAYATIWQEVTFRQSGGVIDAIAVSQETGD